MADNESVSPSAPAENLKENATPAGEDRVIAVGKRAHPSDSPDVTDGKKVRFNAEDSCDGSDNELSDADFESVIASDTETKTANPANSSTNLTSVVNDNGDGALDNGRPRGDPNGLAVDSQGFIHSGHSRKEKVAYFKKKKANNPNHCKAENPPRPFAKFPVKIVDLGTSSTKLASFHPFFDPVRRAAGAVRHDDLILERLNSGHYIAHCKNSAIQDKLSSLKKIGGVAVKCSIPQPSTVGVVYGIPLGEEALQRVRQSLGNASSVERLLTKDQKPTKAVKVTFKLATLPARVHLGGAYVEVTPFSAPVRRCTKCQRLGHSKRQCRAHKSVCSQCSQSGHERGQCTNVKYCINYGGDHSPAYAKCPEHILHKTANKIRAQTYIPYSEAIRRARAELDEDSSPSSPQYDRQYWGPQVLSTPCRPPNLGSHKPPPSVAKQPLSSDLTVESKC